MGLWAVDGTSLVAENTPYLIAALVLHLPVLWLSVVIIRGARRLRRDARAAWVAQQQTASSTPRRPTLPQDDQDSEAPARQAE